jgi:transcriptional regulator NrdR family protein
MSDVKCPYCGEEQEICHDDGYGYEQGEAHEQECYDCEKRFVFYTYATFVYSAGKADCLNGEDHKWTEWKEYSRMNDYIYKKRECHDCAKRQTMHINTGEKK